MEHERCKLFKKVAIFSKEYSDIENANYGLADKERVGNGRFFAL